MPAPTTVSLEAHNPGPMTGSGNHTYLLFDEAGEAAMIDAGVGHSRHLEELDRELQTHRARLARVIVTHGHRDHVEGAPHLFLHTPGHSPDHVSFLHEESGVAFTGDLVLATGSVLIHSSRGGSLAQYLASLERLVSLRLTTLFPAHGPVIHDPNRTLTKTIEHCRLRERQIVEAVRRGRTTVPAITDTVYDGLDAALVLAANENVRAHLEKLRDEGRAFVDDGQWSVESVGG